MAWVAVDETGGEWVFDDKPFRVSPGYFKPPRYWYTYSNKILLPKGSIQKLIGRELSWSDEPVGLK